MNFEEIKNRWKSSCMGEPEKAIEIFILSAILYETDEKEGEAACSLVIQRKKLEKDKNSPSGYILLKDEKKILDTLKQNPLIIRSYTSNINNPSLFLRKKEVARSRAKIVFKSKLENMPTSLFLIREDRYWKITNINAFISNNVSKKS
ncbi:MAG: hypothetical protein ACTSRG_15300 [Candidatus Helarchaeota archaeon]